MSNRWLLAAVLLIPLLMGGRTTYVPETIEHTYTNFASDPAVTTGNAFGPCALTATIDRAGTFQNASCFVPETYSLRLLSFTVIATEALLAPGGGGDEQCQLVLETDSVGSATSGDEVATSSIQVGAANPNAAGTCEAAAVTIDGRGEGCTRDIDPDDAAASVASGGWLRVLVGAPDSGTCDLLQDVVYHIRALLTKGT